MFRTDSVARNGKKTVFYKDVQLRHSTVGQNQDVSTGPLARRFARSLAPLTRSLAPDCSLRSRPPLGSFVCSLAHFTHYLARGTVNDWMAI